MDLEGLTRNDFRRLAEIRLEEAQVLLANGKYDGAYYLAGYAVECALKACLARKTREHDFPDKDFVNGCWNHNLEKLLSHAALGETLIDEGRRRGLLKKNWSTVKDWNEQSRYRTFSTAEIEAREFIEAISDESEGILTWLKNHW